MTGKTRYNATSTYPATSCYPFLRFLLELIDKIKPNTHQRSNLSHKHYKRNSVFSTHQPVSSPVLLSSDAELQPDHSLKSFSSDISSYPTVWSKAHDRLICRLDAEGWELHEIVQRLKEDFEEELGKRVVTSEMVERRLRRLDFDLGVEYWKEGKNDEDGET